LAVSFALVAFGNEYTVLTPQLHVDGWPRLLQSYKFYGMLLLWALHMEGMAGRSRSLGPMAGT
jgi:hypothetical protein